MPVIPVLLITIGVLLLIGVGVIVIFFRAAGNPTITSEAGADIPHAEIMRVSLSESKDAFDSGTAVFVDVRGESYYERSHIPGALSIPLNEIELRRNELDPQDRILLYCT